MPVHSGIRTHIAIVIPGAGLAELFEHAPSLEHQVGQVAERPKAKAVDRGRFRSIAPGRLRELVAEDPGKAGNLPRAAIL